MKKSKLYLLSGSFMLGFAIIFVLFAFNHPEMSFDFPNEISYFIYSAYLILMVIFFILSIIFRKNRSC